MITTTAISIALAITIQAILTANGGVQVTCRGVLFDSTGQEDSQPVWPLDICINTDDSSMRYQCVDNNGVFTIQQATWNSTDCNDGDGHTDWFEDVEASVLTDGCQLTNPCPIAVLNEWVSPSDSSGDCTTTNKQMHLPDVSVALDQCWWDIKQQSYVKLTCSDNGKSTGFGFDLNYIKYTDANINDCTGTEEKLTIDGTGSNCLDGMTDSPYFEDIKCEFPTKVFETECRSVSENNNIVWPLDECFWGESYDPTTQTYKKNSWKYYCEQSGNEWTVRKANWDSTASCEGDSTDSGMPTNVNADGCNRGKICNFVNVDEYLFSDDGNGGCVKNDQGVMNNHVNVSIVTDTCINQILEGSQEPSYFIISCTKGDSTTSFDKITYTEYEDAECVTEKKTLKIDGEPGCLDIPVAPFFDDIKCVERSPVYETECRSVSMNNNINWAIDECISMSAYDENNPTVLQESSTIYKCDDNEELYEVKYEGSSNCYCDSGDSGCTQETDTRAIGVNAHGCSRSKPCNLLKFDEYLNSRGETGEDACAKNENGENNLHIMASIVADTCWLNDRGEYSKLTCVEDSNAAFGYTVTYETFSEADCGGTSEEATISEAGCLDIPESPYFVSIMCDLTTPVYAPPEDCRAVYQNNNTIWPIEYCMTFENKNGLNSMKYVCDDNNELMKEEYVNADNCDGSVTQTIRPDDINSYNCVSVIDCPMAIISEYLNSETTPGECEKNDVSTAEDYMFIDAGIVLNTCWKSHHGDYIKIRCEVDASASASGEGDDFGYRLIYENYTSSVSCEGTPDYVDEIDDPDCLDIPETAFISALTCTGAESGSGSGTSTTVKPKDGGGANSIKNHSMIVWITVFGVVYWMSN